MIKHFKILFGYRELLWVWTRREIKIRYSQSFLGALWAILQPLSMMAIFTLVFSFLARVPSDGLPYPLFSYAALLPWTFFQTSITFSVASLVSNLNLVTKTYFPREVLPLGVIGASFFDFLIASTIFVSMLLYYQVPLRLTMMWLPVLLLIQMLLTVGIALLGAGLNVLYRDIRFVIPLGMQLWLFATPVTYPLSLVPDDLKFLYVLNPMVGIIDSYRSAVLLGQSPALHLLTISGLSALFLFVLGFKVFKRLELSFADVI